MDLGLQVKKINDLMEKRANQAMLEEDLTFSQHHVLVCLMKTEGHSMTLKQLEKHFRVAQATMAGIVKRLESKELVKCTADPQDRRIKVVTLTPGGEESCRRSYRYMKSGEEKMMERLSGAEKEELNRLLTIVYETLREDAEAEENTAESRKENI